MNTDDAEEGLIQNVGVLIYVGLAVAIISPLLVRHYKSNVYTLIKDHLFKYVAGVYLSLLISLLQLFVFLYLTVKREPNLVREESEQSFLDPSTGEKHAFPSVDDPPTIYMTLVAPAYKEEARCKVRGVLNSYIVHAKNVPSAKDDGRDDAIPRGKACEFFYVAVDKAIVR